MAAVLPLPPLSPARLVWVTSALRQRAALRLLAALPPALGARAPLLAELAVAPSGPELAALALVRPCDLIYANDVHTLPAAAWVAALRGVPFLYDARELYEDEDAALSAVQRQARRSVERRLIRRAAAVVTVNELLAQTLARRYAIAPPVVVRNVAPRCALTLPTEPGPAGTLRLLYQSANIGLRQEGTDDLLRAVARTRAQARVTLTLRGGISDEERGRLWVVCRGCERWNLVPIEERWEAIEECARAFRDSRLRASTDDVSTQPLAINAPRCEWRRDICEAIRPALAEVEQGRLSACVRRSAQQSSVRVPSRIPA